MTPAPSAGSPGFLAALIPLTRYDNSFEVTIKADHFSLEVTVEACGHAPLKANGAPAALERELPAAIAKYAQWVETQELSGDDPDFKIEFPRGLAEPKPAPRVRKAVPKRARKKVVARKKPAPIPKVAKRRAPAATKRAAKPQTSRPGKPECIAEYKLLKAKHGDKLTRRIFVDNAKTGRRYEKLWANNWPAFVKEAEGSKAAPASTAAAPAKVGKAKDWPFPTKKIPGEKKKAPAKSAPPKTSKPAKNDKGPWAIKVKGKQIGATIFEKKPGDTVTLSQGKFTVLSVDAEKREIQVEPANAKPAEQPAAPQPAPAAPAPATEPATTEPA